MSSPVRPASVSIVDGLQVVGDARLGRFVSDAFREGRSNVRHGLEAAAKAAVQSGVPVTVEQAFLAAPLSGKAVGIDSAAGLRYDRDGVIRYWPDEILAQRCLEAANLPSEGRFAEIRHALDGGQRPNVLSDYFTWWPLQLNPLRHAGSCTESRGTLSPLDLARLAVPEGITGLHAPLNVRVEPCSKPSFAASVVEHAAQDVMEAAELSVPDGYPAEYRGRVVQERMSPFTCTATPHGTPFQVVLLERAGAGSSFPTRVIDTRGHLLTSAGYFLSRRLTVFCSVPPDGGEAPALVRTIGAGRLRAVLDAVPEMDVVAERYLSELWSRVNASASVSSRGLFS